MMEKEIQTDLINVYSHWKYLVNENGRFLNTWIKQKIEHYGGVWNKNTIQVFYIHIKIKMVIKIKVYFTYEHTVVLRFI